MSLAPDGSLRHRGDLRKLMVDLLHESEPEKAEEIHCGAVRFYTRKGRGVDDRAEEIYHRLRLDQSTEKIDRRWLVGIEQFLFNALDEFTDDSPRLSCIPPGGRSRRRDAKPRVVRGLGDDHRAQSQGAAGAR